MEPRLREPLPLHPVGTRVGLPPQADLPPAASRALDSSSRGRAFPVTDQAEWVPTLPHSHRRKSRVLAPRKTAARVAAMDREQDMGVTAAMAPDLQDRRQARTVRLPLVAPFGSRKP